MIDTDPVEADISTEEQEAFNALMDRYFGFNQSPSYTTHSEEDKEK
jgi:hypothetical protein